MPSCVACHSFATAFDRAPTHLNETLRPPSVHYIPTTHTYIIHTVTHHIYIDACTRRLFEIRTFVKIYTRAHSLENTQRVVPKNEKNTSRAYLYTKLKPYIYIYHTRTYIHSRSCKYISGRGRRQDLRGRQRTVNQKCRLAQRRLSSLPLELAPLLSADLRSLLAYSGAYTYAYARRRAFAKVESLTYIYVSLTISTGARALRGKCI